MNSIDSLTRSFSGRFKQDAEEIVKLGSKMDRAQKEMSDAVKSGDNTRIQLAQMSVEKAAQAIQFKSAAMAAVNKLIEQILARLGQIGG